MRVSVMLIVGIFLFAGVDSTKKKKNPKCRDYTKHFNWRLIDQGTPCGSSAKLQPRVMGGENAVLGEFPWIARLFFKQGDADPSGGCGGSIINNRYILTAAHCCMGTMDQQLMFVRVGEYDDGTKKDCYHGNCAPTYQDYAIREIIPHPAYYPLDTSNDICLLSLEKPIRFSDFVSPVCLPYPCEVQEKDLTGEDLTVAGWGLMDGTNRILDILQKLKVTVVDEKTCIKHWRIYMKDSADKNICAGVKVGHDACGGDSGGPLMYKASVDGPSRTFIMGLVSYGPPCSQRMKRIDPGVYTRVTSFMDWILGNIEDY